MKTTPCRRHRDLLPGTWDAGFSRYGLAYPEAVKRKEFRFFGYGHRKYKTLDPRTILIEELMETHRENVDAIPLLQVAMDIDRQANTDSYFVERKLKLNVDFSGCFIYIAL